MKASNEKTQTEIDLRSDDLNCVAINYGELFFILRLRRGDSNTALMVSQLGWKAGNRMTAE